MKAPAFWLLVLVLPVFSLACTEHEGPFTSSSIEPSASSDVSPFRQRLGLDRKLLELAHKAPTLGGFFLDSSGVLVVNVTDMRTGASVQGIVESFLQEGHPIRRKQVKGIRIQEADYGFAELVEWKDHLDSLLHVGGVVFIDADEGHNRVTIGVTDFSIREEVLRVVSASGVPEGAVRLQLTSSFESSATLQDSVRPEGGGLMIASTKFCTLGFVAIRAGEATFITNSHCTNVQGGVENTIFAQPDATFPNIGIEIADPQYIGLPGCPPGGACRWSDSAAVRLSNAEFQLGRIYGTDNPNSGSIAIIRNLKIVSEVSEPFTGEVLGKVGMVTGWTQGPVSNTCIKITQLDTGKTLLCQDIVDASIDNGDSGSPVFMSLGADEVALYGIAWGGGINIAFSAMGNIEQELGNLSTEDPGGTGCPPPLISC